MFKKSEPTLHFYDRENMPYAADRKRITELAKWLKNVEWQVFCTYTFGWRASDAEADKAFRQYVNCIESTVKADVIYVRGDEKRFSGCGKPACGRHYHAVMASAAPLTPSLLEFFWNSIAGNRNDGAWVLPYDLKQDGLAYVLKRMNQQHGDWSFRKLHLAIPGITAKNQRERRSLQRHQSRLKAFASVVRPKLMPGGNEAINDAAWVAYIKELALIL